MTEQTSTPQDLDRIEHEFEAHNTVSGLQEMQFATNERGDRLMSVDPSYRRKVEALYELHFGTARHNANGKIVDERGRRL